MTTNLGSLRFWVFGEENEKVRVSSVLFPVSAGDPGDPDHQCETSANTKSGMTELRKLVAQEKEKKKEKIGRK